MVAMALPTKAPLNPSMPLWRSSRELPRALAARWAAKIPKVANSATDGD